MIRCGEEFQEVGAMLESCLREKGSRCTWYISAEYMHGYETTASSSDEDMRDVYDVRVVVFLSIRFILLVGRLQENCLSQTGHTTNVSHW